MGNAGDAPSAHARRRRPAVRRRAGSATARTTLTHCPYCSLQCGMNVTAGDRPGDPRARPTSRPTGAACAPRAGRPPSCSTTRERLLRPLVRATPGDRTSPLRRDHLGRRPRPAGRRRSSAPRRGTAATPSAASAAAALTNEQAYQFGKFARVALRTSAIDYNGRFCMSSAAGAGQPGVRARPRAAVPAGRHRRGRRRPAGRQQPGRHHAAGDAVLRRGPRARAPSTSSSTRGAPRPPRNAALHLQPLPGTDLALANGLLHIAIRPRGWSTRTYVAARTTGFEAVRDGVAAYWPDRVERLTGVPVADQRRTVVRPGPRREGDDPHRPRRRAAPQRHRHRAGVDQPGARPRPARPAGQRLRHASPARATGRAAASTGRRPTSCPATGRWTTRPPARTSPRSGASTPTTCRCPGSRRSSCSTARHRRRRPHPAGAGVQRRGLAPRTPTGSSAGSRDLDFLAVSDFFLSETAELADVVLPSAMWAEEDGTMTNLEGRVIRRRKALDPPAGVLDDLQLLATLADRLGAGTALQRRPARRSSRSCAGPAPAASPTTPASATSGSTPSRASSGRARPPDHPGTPRLFADRFADPRRPGPVPPGRARRAPHEPTGRRLPVRAHHRPGDGPVPVAAPRPGAPAACRWSPPTPRAELHPDLARAARHRRGRRRRADHPPRPGRASAPRSPTRSGPTSSSRPFHWGGGSSANALTDPALDPHSAGCPPSRSARSPSPASTGPPS